MKYVHSQIAELNWTFYDGNPASFLHESACSQVAPSLGSEQKHYLTDAAILRYLYVQKGGCSPFYAAFNVS